MNQKGFVITIDSFISVTVALVFILVSFYYISTISLSAWNTVDLKYLLSDELSVLEKSLIFENALKEHSSESILSSLNSTPKSFCFEALLLDSDNNAIVHSLKTGCTKMSTEIISVERTVVVRNDSNVSFYLARVEGWIR